MSNKRQRRLDLDISAIENNEEFLALQEATQNDSPFLNEFVESLRQRSYYQGEIDRLESISSNVSLSSSSSSSSSSLSSSSQMEALILQKSQNDAHIAELVEQILGSKRRVAESEESDEAKALQVAQGSNLEDLKYYINLRNFPSVTATTINSQSNEEKIQKLVKKILEKNKEEESTVLTSSSSTVSSLFGNLKSYTKNEGQPLKICIETKNLKCIKELMSRKEYIEYYLKSSNFIEIFRFSASLGDDDVTNFVIRTMVNSLKPSVDNTTFDKFMRELLYEIYYSGSASNLQYFIQSFDPRAYTFYEAVRGASGNKNLSLLRYLMETPGPLAESDANITRLIDNAMIAGIDNVQLLLSDPRTNRVSSFNIDKAIAFYANPGNSKTKYAQIVNLYFDQINDVVTNNPQKMMESGIWVDLTPANLQKFDTYFTANPVAINEINLYTSNVRVLIRTIIEHPNWIQNGNQRLLEFIIDTFQDGFKTKNAILQDLDSLLLQENTYNKGENPIDSVTLKRINNGTIAWMINNNPQSVYTTETMMNLFRNPNNTWYGGVITVRDPLSNLPITSIKKVIVRVNN